MTLNAKIEGFMDFFGDFGMRHKSTSFTSGATLLSLCDLDREFGICILTGREHPNF